MPVTFVDRPMKTSGTADALMGLDSALRNFMAYREDERNFKLRQQAMEDRSAESRQNRQFRDLQMAQYHQQMDDAAKLHEEQDAEIRGALTTPDQKVKNEFDTQSKPAGTAEPSGANTDELQNPQLDLSGALSGFIQKPQAAPAAAPIAQAPTATPPMGAAFKTGTIAQQPLASMIKGPQVVGAGSSFQAPSEVTVPGAAPTGPLSAEQRVAGKSVLADKAEAKKHKMAGDVLVTDEMRSRMNPDIANYIQAGQWLRPTEAQQAMRIEAKPEPVAKEPHVYMLKNTEGAEIPHVMENGRMVRVPGAVGAPSGGGGDASVGLFPGATGQELMDQIKKKDPNLAANLQGIVEGRVLPEKIASIRKDRREFIMGLAQRIDGNFDPSKTQTRYKMRQDYSPGGKVGKNVTSINTAVQHLETLDKAVEKLGPGNFPWVNKGVNWFREKVGSPELAGVRNAALATASEMAAALKGGTAAPSREEIDDQLKVISESSNKAEWKEVINGRGELLRGRLNSVRDAWTDEFNKQPEKSLLKKSAQDAARHVGLDFSEYMYGNHSGEGDTNPNDPEGFFTQNELAGAPKGPVGGAGLVRPNLSGLVRK